MCLSLQARVVGIYATLAEAEMRRPVGAVGQSAFKVNGGVCLAMHSYATTQPVCCN